MAKKHLNDKTILAVAVVLVLAVVFVSVVGSGALQGFSVLTNRGATYNPPSCSDTDNGKSYAIYGYVHGFAENIPYQHKDYCSSDNNYDLIEYHCNGNSFTYIEHDCRSRGPTGKCVAGSCVLN